MTTKPMKIALLQNDDFSMYHFHGDMIRRFIAAGHQVTAIIPDGKYVDRIRSLGVRVILIRITRFINPVSDALLFVRLFALFRREKFDILHTITIKPNIYGTIAASWAGAQTIVGMVSGAGFVFGVEPKTVQALLDGAISLCFGALGACLVCQPERR
jgi:N,N'-diacetylbacillosaminyl-diphospho-undecaprenol alpha-1,3-N-acetylgalactosaminyltransferase